MSFFAAGLALLYGGSVKAGNAAELFAMPDVDGGLIGGALMVLMAQGPAGDPAFDRHLALVSRATVILNIGGAIGQREGVVWVLRRGPSPLANAHYLVSILNSRIAAALEDEQKELQAKLADSEFYKQGGATIQEAVDRLAQIETELRIYNPLIPPPGQLSATLFIELTSDAALRESRFSVAGHTDARGGDAYNLNLSRLRARAVADYLIKQHGIDAQRLDVEGYGRSRLLDPANPASAVNRRVQITNLGQ